MCHSELWLVVLMTSMFVTHVMCEATVTPSCTNGVMPVCSRPWYPPVLMPALIWINQNSKLSAKSCLLAVPQAPGALYGSRSTYKVAQCVNIHHNNCCHPLGKKSPVPVNHGRPSKSNVGDKCALQVSIICLVKKYYGIDPVWSLYIKVSKTLPSVEEIVP